MWRCWNAPAWSPRRSAEGSRSCGATMTAWKRPAGCLTSTRRSGGSASPGSQTSSLKNSLKNRKGPAMTVISSTKNPEALSFVLVAELDADVKRVWQIWEDPRQLERWWGPPTWPATFSQYEFTPGGEASYYMTGPEGEKGCGWWRMTD